MNQHRHPSGVTVQTVTKETDVINALKGFRVMIARNVPLVSKEMNVTHVLLVTTDICGKSLKCNT